MTSQVYLCAINNILSGYCGEDCKFCTQSTRYETDINRHKLKPISQIVDEAIKAKSYGAIGYCLVTSNKGLNSKLTDYIAETAASIKKVIPDINIIGCNGLATKEQLLYLKKHGVDTYNHNLETSESYYKTICTTHKWSERYETCQNVKSAGLILCTGGVLGMGESIEDQNNLIKSVLSLEPESVPLNFFIPNNQLPLKERTIDKNQALKIIKTVRKGLGEQALLMIAGGREALFTNSEKEMFEAGVNSIVIGDYLTTKGAALNKDLSMLKRIGVEVATECPQF